MTTQPYPNGSIPFVRPPRPPRRQRRELKWDPKVEEERQRRDAMMRCEQAFKAWRCNGGLRKGIPKPKLEDFLPEHLKAEDQPEGLKPVMEKLIEVEDPADDEDAEPLDLAPPIVDVEDGDGGGSESAAFAIPEEDDSQVPGLGVETPPPARKAPKRK